MIVLIVSLFLAPVGDAAQFNPHDDYARRQRLQKSADDWFRREIAPMIVGGPNLRVIHSFGVTVKEKSSVLPPDLGGPRPGSPLEVIVQVSISGMADDNDWGRHTVQCRFSQRLLAKNNGKGKPALIRPGQPLRSPLACVSNGYHRDPRRRNSWGR